MARYNPDGSVDTTFGSGGRVCIDVGPGSGDRGEEILLLAGGQLVVAGTSAGLAVQPDGKLVAAGQTGTDVALARYGAGTTTTTSTSTSTSSTTITPSPFAAVCAVLDQLRSAFAADPWLRPFVGIIDAVRAMLRCA